MALPNILGLKSNYNNKYVQYVKEDDAKTHGYLQCLGENLVTPYTKYQIEIAKNGDGLVHIKCCYNNKYLVLNNLNFSCWLIAGADEPVEDRSSRSCTLFQPIHLDSKTIRFRHVQLGCYACLRSSGVVDFGLLAESKAEDKDQCDVFTIIDWESLCLLPKHVAFKGDNGAYLGVRPIQGDTHLQFTSINVDPTARYEVSTISDGSIRIKSMQTNKFWRCNRAQRDWILADSDGPFFDDHDTIFWPSKVNNNVIALGNLGNNKFCRRFTVVDTFKNLLSANSDIISPEAQLEVEVQKLSTSRNIYNVNYHLKDARIYHQSVDLLLASGSVVNRTKDHYTFDMKLAYIDSKSKAWNASVWPNWGIETNIKASVPLIAGTKVEISADSTGVFEWGKMIERSSISEAVNEITVPPMTRKKVNLLATEGSCDVPFSYDQRDTLTDGNVGTITMDDGIYTGVNYYNFRYETEEEKL